MDCRVKVEDMLQLPLSVLSDCLQVARRILHFTGLAAVWAGSLSQCDQDEIALITPG